MFLWEISFHLCYSPTVDTAANFICVLYAPLYHFPSYDSEEKRLWQSEETFKLCAISHGRIFPLTLCEIGKGFMKHVVGV